MKSTRLAALALLLLLAPLGRALAGNAVLDWNLMALDATRLARNPPPHSALYLATFHIAIFDAVNGITRTNQGWLVNDPAPAGADMDAAIAGAANTVLNALWTWTNPRTLAGRLREGRSRESPTARPRSTALAWGKKVAEAVLAKRADSGYNKPIPGKYSSTDPGKWRETPAAFRPPTLPFWGKVTPFVMTTQSQFRAPPPYTIGSKEYADELAYVNKVGARDGADRTEYQTLTTPFWSDDLGTATPPGHWNVIAEEVARKAQEPLRARDGAALRAPQHRRGRRGHQHLGGQVLLQHVAPRDGAPRDGQDDQPERRAEPRLHPEPGVALLSRVPSGHSGFSAAAARILALFFGTDDIEFSIGSDGLPGVVHTFTKLSDAQREAGMSRVFGGIHTMSDNIEGQKAGSRRRRLGLRARAPAPLQVEYGPRNHHEEDPRTHRVRRPFDGGVGRPGLRGDAPAAPASRPRRRRSSSRSWPRRTRA